MGDTGDIGELDAETLIHAIGGVVWEYDCTTDRFTYVSDEAERLLGSPKEHWYETGFWGKRLHPEDASWVPSYCMEAARSGEDHELVYRLMHADSSAVWVRDLITVDPRKREKGTLRGLMIDITGPERRAGRRVTRADSPADCADWHSDLRYAGSEARYRILFAQLPIGLITYRLDADGELVVETANPAACKALRLAPCEATGRLMTDIALGARMDGLYDDFLHIARNGGYLRRHAFEYRDGTQELFLDVRAFQLSRRTIGVTFQDVTARQKALEQQRQDCKRLDELTRQLTGTENRERQRLAELVHDNIGQPLAVARIYLRQLINPESRSEPEDLNLVLELINLTIQETRLLTAELHPVMLNAIGLRGAIASLCNDMCNTHGARIIMEEGSADDTRLADDVRATLFRAARELVLNAIKYSDASTIRVAVESDKREFQLTVRDDGKGFDAKKMQENPTKVSFGLPSIMYRIEGANGSMDIDAAPGEGTTVTIRVPITSMVSHSIA